MSTEPNARTLQYWAQFQSSVGGTPPARLYEAFHFGDSEALAEELASLVLAGVKQATASLLWTFEVEQRALPQAGDLSIVEAWSGEPLCVIETTSVKVVPFTDVSAEFAAVEGEGDGSLQSWRTGHWGFFGRECSRIRREPSKSMQVVCERFKVVYRARAVT